jgi:DNA-binding transcriptional LysR family regulator
MKLEVRLRAFAAFARQRSFSGATAELRISQTAISKHIAELEHALELKLVERARRDGALTTAGEFVANYVLLATVDVASLGMTTELACRHVVDHALTQRADHWPRGR